MVNADCLSGMFPAVHSFILNLSGVRIANVCKFIQVARLHNMYFRRLYSQYTFINFMSY